MYSTTQQFGTHAAAKGMSEQQVLAAITAYGWSALNTARVLRAYREQIARG